MCTAREAPETWSGIGGCHGLTLLTRAVCRVQRRTVRKWANQKYRVRFS